MAIGTGILLQQVVTKGIQIGSKYFDYALAVSVGTGIGIGNNPEVQQLYRYWRGQTTQHRDKIWHNKFIRRRFKGDVFIDETSNTQQETFPSDNPVYRDNGKRQQRVNYGLTRKSYKSKRNHRRCYCKSRLHRTMGNWQRR